MQISEDVICQGRRHNSLHHVQSHYIKDTKKKEEEEKQQQQQQQQKNS